MSDAQIDQWLQAGQGIGSHTQSHADLNTLNASQAQEEIAGSRANLTHRFGEEAAKHFCYPYGRYNAATLALVKEAGYLTATTTQRARALPSDPLLELPRVADQPFERPSSPPAFVCTLQQTLAGCVWLTEPIGLLT